MKDKQFATKSLLLTNPRKAALLRCSCRVDDEERMPPILHHTKAKRFHQSEPMETTKLSVHRVRKEKFQQNVCMYIAKLHLRDEAIRNTLQ